jgi:hypothetical protein
MFTGLSSLTKLAITGFKQLTRIVSLPATLEHIELFDNCIENIEPDAFRILSKLTHLSLNENCLISEKKFPAIGHLTHLEHLYLRDNITDSLDGLKSISLLNLRVLNLRDCKVRKLSKQTFATLPGLVNLDLVRNEIAEIEAGAFDGLINLRVLNLAGNNFDVFYFNVFESAANELGPPVNLLDLSIDADSLESVQWSPETITLVEDSMSKLKEKEKSEAHAAVSLFAKVGFRNKLHIILKRSWDVIHKLTESPFLKELELTDFVRVLCP